jgi:hypothetical protein
MLCCAACAPAGESDAIVLLRIRVPYEEGDRPLARVQVNRNDPRFDFDETAWESPKPFEVNLADSPSHEIELAVRTDDPDAQSSQALLIRIAFCDPKGDKPCDRDPETPELAFAIDHPFYAGELTEWHAGPAGDTDFHMPGSEIPSHQRDFPRRGLPATLIKACSVAGCIEVADQPGAEFTPDPDTGYCREDDDGVAVHFCAEDSR